MPQPLIIAAARRIDGRGSVAAANAVAEALADRGARLRALHIAPLSHPWTAPLPEGWFRSGCAPLEALAEARRLLAANDADAVVIRGRDLLRSEYAADRALRGRRMAIYGEDTPLTEAYTELARAFCRRTGLDAGAFRDLADRLFDNHCRVWREAGHAVEPRPEWFAPVTELFRRADCANPVVDFEGVAVVATPAAAEVCGVPESERVALLGLGLGYTPGEGPDSTDEIAAYRHLEAAFRQACAEAEVEFAARFRDGGALLEAYTCYPVVPLGFLLASGIAADAGELPEVLARHPITVTGGMNLARAAWNNPALGGLVALWERLTRGEAPLAALHANGGLGEKQGVAILGTHRPPAN